MILHRIRSIARRFLALPLIVAGAACGVAAVLFHRYVDGASEVLIGFALRQHGAVRVALILGIPTVVSALLAAIGNRFAPFANGANLARVRRAYEQEPKILDKRSVVATFLLTPLSLAAGAPLGPEGPIVVVTSGVAMAIARVLALPKKIVRGMIPVGTAAGIAAIFRTPITGVVFAIEEVMGTTSRGILAGAILAAVAAAVVDHVLLGADRLLPASAAGWNEVRDLAGFAVIGIAAGVLAGTVIRLISKLRPPLERLIPSVTLRAAAGGACIGALGLIAPRMLGVGYGTTSLLLRGGGSLELDALALGAKTLGFVLAMSAGLLGGTFAPSLFIGAALGALVGHTVGALPGPATVDTGAYALVGMGAYFGGFLRCPMAAVLIVLELTNDYGLVIPLMLAVAIATAISHKIAPQTLTERQMFAEGMRPMLVKDAMTKDPIAAGADEPLRDFATRTGERRHRQYPVVAANGRLIGILPGTSIARALRENANITAGEAIASPHVIARADEPLADVIARMGIENADRCPVVAGDGSNVLVGWLSSADLLRARLRQSKEGTEPEISLFG